MDGRFPRPAPRSATTAAGPARRSSRSTRRPGRGLRQALEIYQGHLYGNDTDFGGGWSSINLIAGPGDLNGDGTGDFVARDRDGVLWLYRSNYDGTALHARVKIGSGWNAYNQILGSGDYTSDGLNDLVARAKDGTLYLYQGTGQGELPVQAPREEIGGGWNAYPKLVAPGDLTGDGQGDLLAVNAGGELFRYSGTGQAGYAFKPRASIGTGHHLQRSVLVGPRTRRDAPHRFSGAGRPPCAGALSWTEGMLPPHPGVCPSYAPSATARRRGPSPTRRLSDPGGSLAFCALHPRALARAPRSPSPPACSSRARPPPARPRRVRPPRAGGPLRPAVGDAAGERRVPSGCGGRRGLAPPRSCWTSTATVAAT
ncbi:hypothetical protein STANM309S_03999 [Streptomyces tanashiensis]